MPDTRRESTSDDGDDGEYHSDDPDITLASIEWSKTINFSIRANYTNWAPREAFRELVQNWDVPFVFPCCLRGVANPWARIRRDGIIRSFHLAERDFHVVREEKTSDRDTEIVYRVPRPGSDDAKESLGYVRFKGGRDGSGTIEITNRSAMLQPWHLDLGGTSKAGDAHQAGARGEGLKVALLVLMRGFQNHSIKCPRTTASSAAWAASTGFSTSPPAAGWSLAYVACLPRPSTRPRQGLAREREDAAPCRSKLGRAILHWRATRGRAQ
jgi:hypothetical protein